MMARFIDTIVQCQKGCRESAEYERFLEREELRKLFMIDEEHLLMDYDVSVVGVPGVIRSGLNGPYQMQRSRMALPDIEGYEDNLRSTGPRTAGRDPAHHKDAAIFRKLLNFSWA